MDEHNHIHIQMVLTSVLTICCLLLTTLPHCVPAYNYLDCKRQTYNCGELSYISYPFWGQNHRDPECGGGDPFELKCDHDETTIVIGSQSFTVKEINMTAQNMTLVRTDLVGNVCSLQFGDTYNVNSSTLFRYPPSVQNITIFYECPPIPDFPNEHSFNCGPVISYFVVEDELTGLFNEYPQLHGCKSLHVPTDTSPRDYTGDGVDALTEGLDKGFEVDYRVSQECTKCLGSEGDCWSDGIDKHVLSCYYCPDGSHALHCPSKNKWNWKGKVIVGVTGAAIAGLLICIAILCLRYKSSTWQGHFGLTTKSNQNIEEFLKNHGALTLKRCKLSEMKKMTNNFKVKLGQGGFGAVYKGNLSHGSPVAVKILNASKKNGEEFINEVASISRTSHINVVNLLGFCLEGHKRALIYEFMPNGSLDKFIYRKELETITPLSWDIIYQIAMGIAQGLEYLHRGCNTRILHFDIKPHNILLDENFCPKISDFGLAKLCPRNESIISLSDARGTMGYVAPEMWSRHLGGVSHKSDVYSYGMMLLEMVGGRKNINAEASHTSEIYFPHWAYKNLELDNDLRPDMLMTTEENEVAKRLAIVGLWCTQTFPNDRPTMSGVIDMLEAT
ncbi:Receptor protein kinase [Spatholobus suberectus]|nr:Receptor protein kinase [Spatholobus suberectus]